MKNIKRIKAKTTTIRPCKIKRLIKTGIFSVIEKLYKSRNGNFKRTIIKHNGAVAVIPVIGKNKIILLKQFRHTIDDYLYEIPAGTLEKDETPGQCAIRELEEETGYKTRHLKKLFSIYLAPGYSTELLTVFVATHLYKGKFHPEIHENITPEIFSLSELQRMIKKGKIKDAKTLSALLYYMFCRT